MVPLMLSEKFEGALTYATRLHAKQTRKGTEIPYVSHLLGVASIALEHGAPEHVAIAAVLHDAVEDQANGGRTKLEIGEKFGQAVLEIVLACSDAEADAGAKKAPWRDRKQKYIKHLALAKPDSRFVSACDKLHNARCILADYRTHGERLWDRFSGGREGTLWYYRALVTAFKEPPIQLRLLAELESVVGTLEAAAAAARAPIAR